MAQTFAIKNNAGGFDLMTERDSGNKVLILTGSYTYSLEYWQHLKALADDVIYTMENVTEEVWEETILP